MEVKSSQWSQHNIESCCWTKLPIWLNFSSHHCTQLSSFKRFGLKLRVHLNDWRERHLVLQFPEHDLFVFPSCNNTVALFIHPHGHYSTWETKSQTSKSKCKCGTQDDSTDISLREFNIVWTLDYTDTIYAKRNFSSVLGSCSYS